MMSSDDLTIGFSFPPRLELLSFFYAITDDDDILFWLVPAFSKRIFNNSPTMSTLRSRSLNVWLSASASRATVSYRLLSTFLTYKLNHSQHRQDLLSPISL